MGSFFHLTLKALHRFEERGLDGKPARIGRQPLLDLPGFADEMLGGTPVGSGPPEIVCLSRAGRGIGGDRSGYWTGPTLFVTDNALRAAQLEEVLFGLLRRLVEHAQSLEARLPQTGDRAFGQAIQRTGRDSFEPVAVSVFEGFEVDVRLVGLGPRSCVCLAVVAIEGFADGPAAEPIPAQSTGRSTPRFADAAVRSHGDWARRPPRRPIVPSSRSFGINFLLSSRIGGVKLPCTARWKLPQAGRTCELRPSVRYRPVRSWLIIDPTPNLIHHRLAPLGSIGVGSPLVHEGRDPDGDRAVISRPGLRAGSLRGDRRQDVLGGDPRRRRSGGTPIP